MDRTIGTCSNCGGRVTLPEIWMGVIPPVPTCQSCGATQKQPHGPVIEMERPDPNKVTRSRAALVTAMQKGIWP